MSKRIILHTLNFEKFWAHYSLIHDSDFINFFSERGYKCEFSINTIIKNDDIILFIETNSIGVPLFLFKELNLFKRLVYLLKFILQINKYLTRRIRKKSLNKTKCFLLILESELHAPENHIKSINKFCNKIFTWNDNLIKEKGFIKIQIPQSINKVEINKVKFINKKLLVNISSNKFSNSKIELYSKRLDSISFFDKFHPNEFDLYGFDWNIPINHFFKKGHSSKNNFFNTYKGTVEDKILVMSQYRFALIYENCRVDGYITEKIFDCFYSKCVPIYLGAPNIKKYIPSNCYIDRDIFQNDEQLYNFISNINESQYEVYLNNIYKFLNSSQYIKFLSRSLAEIMLSEFEII